MGLTLKIGSATALLGFAGCGSMCASGCVNTIKMQLEKEGFTLISSEEKWNNIFTSLKDKELQTKVDLKKSCETLLKQSPSEDNWKLTVKWCVEEKSVSEILGKNYTILKTGEEQNNEKSSWDSKVQKLRQSKKFKDWKEAIINGTTDAEKLKKACKDLSPQWIKTRNQNFKDVFEKTRAFCAIKKKN